MVIDIETLFTIVFVLVDDWYRAYAVYLLKGKRGAKPEFSDSEVITLMDRDLNAGRYRVQWDARDAAGRAMASGVYFYRVEAGEHAATAKMILMR